MVKLKIIKKWVKIIENGQKWVKMDQKKTKSA
jgi:hypothetical protein